MRAFITRDFKDAGTEESFTGTTIVPDMKKGAFTNYEAAGLVRAPTAADEETAKQAAAEAADADADEAPASAAPASAARPAADDGHAA